MNIHEHQAKEILKEFGAPVSNGFVVFSVDEIPKKIIKLNTYLIQEINVKFPFLVKYKILNLYLTN